MERESNTTTKRSFFLTAIIVHIKRCSIPETNKDKFSSEPQTDIDTLHAKNRRRNKIIGLSILKPISDFTLMMPDIYVRFGKQFSVNWSQCSYSEQRYGVNSVTMELVVEKCPSLRPDNQYVCLAILLLQISILDSRLAYGLKHKHNILLLLL